MNETVAIFIDGSNLYHALKNNFRRMDLNYSDFAKKLCGQRPLFRVYYYNVLQEPSQYPETHREQQEFLDVLRKAPYLEVRLGGIKKAQGVPVEKGLDIMLATDMICYAPYYDVAILVSGDADFTYALQAVKNLGKHVEVAYFESGVSRDLLDVVDDRHLLDRNFFADLWVSQRREGRRRRQIPRKTKPFQKPAEYTPPPFPPSSIELI